MKVTISVGLVGGRYSWPNGKPTESEVLPDGRTRHLLEDGRRFTVAVKPTYAMEYLSTWVGAEPGDTYTVHIAIAGMSAVEGFYEAWNYDISQVRNYAFAKTMQVTDLETGDVLSGPEFERALRSQVGAK